MGCIFLTKKSHFGVYTVFKDKYFTPPNICENNHFMRVEQNPLIVDWLKKHPSVENLGVMLVFQTGMCEAELSAIKFSDYCGNKLHVHSQEIKYKSPETGKLIHEFVEYTKTDAGDRYIYLSPSAVETIQKIKELNPDNDYMMMVGTRKIYTNTFNDRLYKTCDACGIPRRSMHKIRKTYGTIPMSFR